MDGREPEVGAWSPMKADRWHQTLCNRVRGEPTYKYSSDKPEIARRVRSTCSFKTEFINY